MTTPHAAPRKGRGVLRFWGLAMGHCNARPGRYPTPSTLAADAPVSLRQDGDQLWFVLRSGKEIGPMTLTVDPVPPAVVGIPVFFDLPDSYDGAALVLKADPSNPEVADLCLLIPSG